MEISIKNVTKPTDRHFSTYAINLNGHQIFTVVTESAAILCKWLNAVVRAPANTRSHGITVVGVSVAEEAVSVAEEDVSVAEEDVSSRFTHVLTLCVGSHTLRFLFPEPSDGGFKKAVKYLSGFFRSSAVKTIAFNSDHVADILFRHYNVEIDNLFDARYDVVAPELWLRRRRSNGDGKYVDVRGLNLDELVAATLVGKNMEVVRPKNITVNLSSLDLIKFSNLDSFLLFLIGYDFAHTFVGGSRFFSPLYRIGLKSQNEKKKKKKMMKKNKEKKKKKNANEH